MVLSFDGMCVLCNGFVRFLARHDGNGRLQFASSGSHSGAEMFRTTDQDPDNPVTVILIGGDQRYVESDAIIRSIMALGGMWRLAGIFLAVPVFLRDKSYRFVARNRFRWFERLDHCPQPPPGWSDRFLT